jgi:hypothetical protein
MSDEQPEIKSLNKDGRPRSIYYRPVKNELGQTVDWMPTLLLPADPQGREQYLAKGFKLEDPRISKESAVVKEDKVDLTAELQEENRKLRQELEAAKAVVPVTPAAPAMTPMQERMAKMRAAKVAKV